MNKIIKIKSIILFLLFASSLDLKAGCYGITFLNCMAYGPFPVRCGDDWVIAEEYPYGSYGVTGTPDYYGLTDSYVEQVDCGYGLKWVCGGTEHDQQIFNKHDSSVIFGTTCGPFG